VPGEEGFLAWGSNQQGKPDVPIRINSFVLAEVIYAFTSYVTKIFGSSTTKPESLRLYIGLNNMSRGEKHATLTSSEAAPYIPRPERFQKKAPSSECILSLKVPIDETPERMAFLLRSKLYNWFGFDDSQIPYATTDAEGRQIVNQTSLFKKGAG
jgi:hypothetical protein